MSRRFKSVAKWLVGIGVILTAVYFAIDVYDRHTLPPAFLALEALPGTAKVNDCASQGITDAFTVCTLTVSAAEFPTLLTGRTFSRDNDTSLMQPPPGIEVSLTPAEHYTVSPPEFKRGGAVDVYTDSSRTNVAIYFYEE